jgi:hypothetical protein
LRGSASSLPFQETKSEAVALCPFIRPEFLRWLAIDQDAALYIDPNGIRVFNATLPGDLNLRGCHVRVPLILFHCTVHGEIMLQSAETKSLLLFDSSVDNGVFADIAVVNGALFFSKCVFSGAIVLRHAHVSSALNFTGSKLCVSDGFAFAADSTVIGGAVFLKDGFESNGPIRMPATQINGDLDFHGAKLLPLQGDALSAHGANIEGNVWLNGNFQSSGSIRFDGAKIAGSLFCEYATLSATNGSTLSIGGSMIGGNVYLRKGFESYGLVSLQSAHIEGSLSFIGAKFAGADCSNIRLAGDLLWMGIEPSGDVALFLTGARVRRLRDELGSWPERGKLFLDGFVYDGLSLHDTLTEQQIEDFAISRQLPVDTGERLEWLMRQPSAWCLRPQPWIQFSTYLDSIGDRKGAKHVINRFRCLRAVEEARWFLPQQCAIFFAWLEEMPARIIYSITVTLILGWVIFGHAAKCGALAPTDVKAYDAYTTGESIPSAYPILNPFIYTLENGLPLVRLGQDEKWAPDQHHVSKSVFTGYWFLMWTRWLMILSGWFQATVLAIAFSRRFK